MISNDLQPSETVVTLAQRTFSAADVMTAADVTADQLDLFQRKAGLVLCSDPPGRGRARRFCLLDVYLVTLMGRLTRLTGSQSWSAASLGYAVYPPFPATMQGSPLHRGADLDQRRADLCADIRAAHPLFWTRSWHSQPWIVFAEDSHVSKGIFGVEVANVADLDALVHRREGYFLNVTRLLDAVDKRLLSTVEAV